MKKSAEKTKKPRTTTQIKKNKNNNKK